MSVVYRDLVAWQKAMDLTAEIYRATQKFPREELYGLRSQMRRAAVSVPSNIAEGQGRRFEGEFHHFLRNARGSLPELGTQIQLAGRLRYFSEPECDGLVERTAEVGRILNGLIAAVNPQRKKTGQSEPTTDN